MTLSYYFPAEISFNCRAHAEQATKQSFVCIILYDYNHSYL
jgi:hypothetical protein